MELGHVVVLAGGLSYEREVSLRSGRRVADALRALDISVEIRDTDATLLDSLTDDPPDAVFPVLHGAAGEDGSIREILELLGVPYVGARPDACRVAWDKPTAQSVVRRAGLRTPDSVAFPKEVFHDLGASAVLDLIISRLGLPLFVKPTRGGSALGASAVYDASDLSAAMVGCFAYGDAALVEEYITGTEVAVSVIERDGAPTALPAVEIVAPGGRYDYTARYDAGDTTFVTPARLSPEAMAGATEAAVTAHRALGLRSLSRTDLIVSPDGEVYFLEVNVAPGMTETSLFPRAISGADLDLGEVCRDLLMDCIDN
ncbi:MAG TPA: D-alanine--D-alanine ligase [Spirillospora sp.]